MNASLKNNLQMKQSWMNHSQVHRVIYRVNFNPMLTLLVFMMFHKTLT